VPFFSSKYKHGKREGKRTTVAAKESYREYGKLGSGALSLLCKSCALLLLFNIQTWEKGDEENDRCSEGKSKGVREVRVWCFFSALQVLCALLLLSNIQTWEEGEEEDDRCSEGKSKGVGEMKRRYQELDG
jgi:hypothetical protein